MHLPPQSVVPPEHWVAHLPFEQTSPALQLVPHWPQWPGSELTSTHLPPQSLSPAAHLPASAPLGCPSEPESLQPGVAHAATHERPTTQSARPHPTSIDLDIPALGCNVGARQRSA